MAPGVVELAGPVAIELVLDGLGLFGAGLDGVLEGLVDVLDVDGEGDGRAAELLRVVEVHVGRGVGHHDHRVADLDLGVADAAVGAGHAETLLGAEDLLVELDGVAGAVDGQVGGDAGIVVGDGLHCGHWRLLSRSACLRHTPSSIRSSSGRF